MSRSGYYKWLARDKTPPAERQRILRLVEECHEAHPSHGYRWVRAWIVQHNADVSCSADYVRKCFSRLGIRSETGHKRKRAGRRDERERSYPNLIFSTWETVDRPRQVLVSDMTAFWTKSRYWELALYFDVFTKQIVGRGLTQRRGWRGIYYESLSQAIEAVERAKEGAVGLLEEGSGHITVAHTDQGSVYTSKAYNEIIKEKGLVRSMSRAGKPTDNPVNESLNGWIKEELFCDFGIADAPDCEVPRIIDDYIRYYNGERPSWSLGYRTPDAFYAEFVAGGVERRDTFAHRVLDPTPKFVREKLARAEEGARRSGIGTSDPLMA